MMMTPGAIYRNLDGWNYGMLGPYVVDESQGEAIKHALSLAIKKPMEEEKGNLEKGIPTVYHCPLCKREVKQDWKACPYCCQWIIKKQ